MDSNPRAQCWGSEPDPCSRPFITAVFDGWSVAFLTPYDTHSDQTILAALSDDPSPSLPSHCIQWGVVFHSASLDPYPPGLQDSVQLAAPETSWR